MFLFNLYLFNPGSLFLRRFLFCIKIFTLKGFFVSVVTLFFLFFQGKNFSFCENFIVAPTNNQIDPSVGILGSFLFICSIVAYRYFCVNFYNDKINSSLNDIDTISENLTILASSKLEEARALSIKARQLFLDNLKDFATDNNDLKSKPYVDLVNFISEVDLTSTFLNVKDLNILTKNFVEYNEFFTCSQNRGCFITDSKIDSFAFLDTTYKYVFKEFFEASLLLTESISVVLDNIPQVSVSKECNPIIIKKGSVFESAKIETVLLKKNGLDEDLNIPFPKFSDVFYLLYLFYYIFYLSNKYLFFLWLRVNFYTLIKI